MKIIYTLQKDEQDQMTCTCVSEGRHARSQKSTKHILLRFCGPLRANAQKHI